jgi:phosphate transport system substrate-binding protein
VLHNNKTFPLTLALLLSFGVYLEPTRAEKKQQLIVAQAAAKETTFSLPDKMPEGSVVKISSSQNVEQINNNLQEKFESQYSGAKVEVSSTDSDAALEAVASKKADLAAISRPLTEAEVAQGFKTVPINKEKIAIIVGENNPYDGNLTIQQFAQIFRGEITDWSEIGGPSGAIRVIDRVDTNDTRRSFPSYPVFQSAEFKAGSNATVPSNTEMEAIVKELGTDGISYAPVSATKDLQGIKVVVMHQTLPADPRYPFSQPNLYVYQGEPSDAVKGFLGFVTAPVGQGIIQNVLTIASPLAGVNSSSATTPSDPSSTATETKTTPETTPEKAATDSTTATAPATTPSDASTTATDTKTNPEKAATDSTTATAPATTPSDTNSTATAPETTPEKAATDSTTATAAETATETQPKGWLWWLLPLALLIPLLAFLMKKGKDSESTTNIIDESDRELVGAGVNRPNSNNGSDNDNNGIVAGTALATGLGAAAIANRRQEQSNFPNQVDLNG